MHTYTHTGVLVATSCAREAVNPPPPLLGTVATLGGLWRGHTGLGPLSTRRWRLCGGGYVGRVEDEDLGGSEGESEGGGGEGRGSESEGDSKGERGRERGRGRGLLWTEGECPRAGGQGRWGVRWRSLGRASCR